MRIVISGHQTFYHVLEHGFEVVPEVWTGTMEEGFVPHNPNTFVEMVCINVKSDDLFGYSIAWCVPEGDTNKYTLVRNESDTTAFFTGEEGFTEVVNLFNSINAILPENHYPFLSIVTIRIKV